MLEQARAATESFDKAIARKEAIDVELTALNQDPDIPPNWIAKMP